MMQQLTLEMVIRRKKEISAADLGMEVAMLNEENGMYYALGEVGTRIWQLIENEVSIKTIVEQLLLEYEVEKDECEKDVFAFMDKMVASKLVYISNCI
ncbi:MAG: PqqD family protein [Firmicutes bacterium HGW-Firmicutes-1]|jgi:hypothetical protein|nr:MAG: PqqD family protein [Firmicutes bacterium HGW-Firmicutes-1]